MAGLRWLSTAMLFALAACARTALEQPRSVGADGGAGGMSDAAAAGGASGAASGNDAQPRGGGAGGASVGSGGAVSAGGASPFGGRTTGGGGSGTAGMNRTGGSAGGGDRATGGVPASGGRPTTGGVFGTGGSRAGGSLGSGGRPVTGGVGGAAGTVGVGGAATGGVAHGGGGAPATGGSHGTGGIVPTGGSLGTGGLAGATGGTVGTGAGGATGTAVPCGNGTIDPGEQCDLGAGNDDAPAFLVTQAGRSFAATPVVRSVTSAEFYDYSSASAHTGMEEAGTSRIMLFVNSSALELALVFFHGIDKDSTGVEQPRSHVQLVFGGLPETTVVTVADEQDELFMTSATSATGFWTFTNNTDGGALSGFPFPGDWEISVEPTFNDGILFWTWAQSESAFIHFDLTSPLTIKARSAPSQCRSDCTIPRCGDGILDGGEICDGGAQSGSGCSSDCKSFN